MTDAIIVSVICITLLIIFCAGTPDLLDACIARVMPMNRGIDSPQSINYYRIGYQRCLDSLKTGNAFDHRKFEREISLREKL